MGKKSTKKGSKKGSKGKKGGGPQFQAGSGEFVFSNGDQYSGEYCAHRTGLVWRQGRGTYVTHDGQTYEAIWNNDKLDESENVKIEFDGGDEFLGRMSKNKFEGPGNYVVNKRGCLTANFVNNKPAEKIVFIDYKGNCWYGSAENEHALLYQEHIFFTELDENKGRGVPKNLQLTETEEEFQIAEEESELDIKELEKRIFAKSTKTPRDTEDSEWLRNSHEAENSQIILETMELEGEFSEKFPEKLFPQNLLDRFFSDEYKKSCPAVRVMYVSPPLVENQEESGPDPDC